MRVPPRHPSAPVKQGPPCFTPEVHHLPPTQNPQRVLPATNGDTFVKSSHRHLGILHTCVWEPHTRLRTFHKPPPPPAYGAVFSARPATSGVRQGCTHTNF